MRRSLVVLLSLVLLLPISIPEAKKKAPSRLMRTSVPERVDVSDLPASMRESVYRPFNAFAAGDTVNLATFDFETGTQGWESADRTAQVDTFFHIAGLLELDGGTFGKLDPINGNQSLWCGQAASGDPRFCGFATLPGYGDDWNQFFVSKTFDCDSIVLEWEIWWDTEPSFDQIFVEWFDSTGDEWIKLSVPGGTGFGFYDNTPFNNQPKSESFSFATTGLTQIRFRFVSDGQWSDVDGLWPSDGACIIDDIVVECYNNGILDTTYTEDFEGETAGALATDDGVWAAEVRPGIGDFASTYDGFPVLQEDGCFTNVTKLWGFFDDPLVTNYNCGGFPQQGAMPYFTPDGMYMNNEIWSPPIPYAGVGDGGVVLLTFNVYRDLPLFNLQFYNWSVRSWVGGCPGEWRNDNLVFFGAKKDWAEKQFSIGAHLEGVPDSIQVALGALDMCELWCGTLGTGSCHSHAPLFDNVRVDRIELFGPHVAIRDVDLFQDNFAQDGTLTGKARADMANDVAPSTSPNIVPGDSIVIIVTDPVSGIDLDPNGNAAVYAYVNLRPKNQPGKAAVNLEAPELDPTDGDLRFSLIDSIMFDNEWWYQFQMDSAEVNTGAVIEHQFCFDLNDAVFTPGDTIRYVVWADNTINVPSYSSRRLNGQGDIFTTEDRDEALSSPMEFTILPAAALPIGMGGLGGDILYVDDTDDRGGPSQLFFDSAFNLMGILNEVDRYDVLAPSSVVPNSLGSRVQDVFTQIIGVYQKIIWSSGNLNIGLIGRGGNSSEKSDDFALLFTFLDQSADNPGLYINGDGIAAEWAQLGTLGAIDLKSTYCNFNLIAFSHVDAGEDVNPLLVADGPCFTHLGIPDSLIAFGGCPLINSFNVISPTGLSVTEFTYPNLPSGHDAVISQETSNAAATTARVILSGFSFHYIRDNVPKDPIARVEHLTDIIRWLQNILPDPVGIDPRAPQFVNYLDRNYPNPFNPTTRIRYGVKERGHVTLRVYNVAGQMIRTLVNEVKSPDPLGFEVTWDGKNSSGEQVSSGVYFYKMVSQHFSQTKKMVLLK